MKKRVILGALIAGLLTISGGNNVFAASGNTATISGGSKAWNICVETGETYNGSQFAVDISKTGFKSQVVLGSDFTEEVCKKVKLPAGDYTVSLNNPMKINGVSYGIEYDTAPDSSESDDNTLTYTISNVIKTSVYTFGSSHQEIAGDAFPKLFAIEGTCVFSYNATISGDTCVDSNNNSFVGQTFVNTGVSLFSEENAGKDFEIYFEMVDYARTQGVNQGTVINSKYENQSRYYPGFVLRTLNNNGNTLELTSRLGNSSNSSADTFKLGVDATAMKGKSTRIVRINGVIKISIDNGAYQTLGDFSSFHNYFNQAVAFGASLMTDNTPQRRWTGTLRNMYIKIGDYDGSLGTINTASVLNAPFINGEVLEYMEMAYNASMAEHNSNSNTSNNHSSTTTNNSGSGSGGNGSGGDGGDGQSNISGWTDDAINNDIPETTDVDPVDESDSGN